MNDSSALDIVRSVIRSRKTLKVLADSDRPINFESTTEQDDFVRQAVTDSGWAPFHYDRKLDQIAEPWRCHVLWHQACRSVARQMPSWFPDMKPTNKLPSMLSACGALALVTWLPASAEEITDTAKLNTVNEEHLAATSSMVQNLLLLCTAADYGSYWSSGGQFKTPLMFEKLGISPIEKLAAAVFIEYPQTQSKSLERLPGKNREKRSEARKWMREVEL